MYISSQANDFEMPLEFGSGYLDYSGRKEAIYGAHCAEERVATYGTHGDGVEKPLGNCVSTQTDYQELSRRKVRSHYRK